MKYTPEKCEHCGQTKTYILALDRGIADIVKAFSKAIKIKGINVIHPIKEMADRGLLTINQIKNLSRARYHGLIALVEGKHGNWCLTRKGMDFLNGASVPKYAIVSKISGTIGHLEESVMVKDFTSDTEYWEGVGFTISEGKVILP